MNHEIHEAHEKAETLAYILAEMHKRMVSHYYSREGRNLIRQYASRIEAAWKREREDLNPSGRGAAKTRGQKASARRAAESCLGTGEVEYSQTVQIGGKMSGGGRAEANRRGTATAGAAPEPAKSSRNGAAMRKAAESALIVVRGIIDGTLARRNPSVFDCRDKLKSALAAPARNCDVQFLDQVEMYDAFKDWCKAKGHTMEPMLAYDAFDWLLAPANKKGETDGSK